LKRYCNPKFKEECPCRENKGLCACKENCSQQGIIEENRWGRIWMKLNRPSCFWPSPISLEIRVQK
jgi:hypothetical protein